MCAIDSCQAAGRIRSSLKRVTQAIQDHVDAISHLRAALPHAIAAAVSEASS